MIDFRPNIGEEGDFWVKMQAMWARHPNTGAKYPRKRNVAFWRAKLVILWVCDPNAYTFLPLAKCVAEKYRLAFTRETDTI